MRRSRTNNVQVYATIPFSRLYLDEIIVFPHWKYLTGPIIIFKTWWNVRPIQKEIFDSNFCHCFLEASSFGIQRRYGIDKPKNYKITYRHGQPIPDPHSIMRGRIWLPMSVSMLWTGHDFKKASFLKNVEQGSKYVSLGWTEWNVFCILRRWIWAHAIARGLLE